MMDEPVDVLDTVRLNGLSSVDGALLSQEPEV
jgi:hypothetical protein